MHFLVALICGLQVVGLGFDPVTKHVYWGTRKRVLAAPLKESALPRTVLDIGEV